MKYVTGIHLTIKNNEISIKSKKQYTWVIPEKLEKENISKGDIVLVACKNTKAPVIVLDIFESDKERIKHKKVLKILSKVKKINDNING